MLGTFNLLQLVKCNVLHTTKFFFFGWLVGWYDNVTFYYTRCISYYILMI